MTARRTPFRVLVATASGALGFLPLALTSPAHAATLSCSASSGTLTVNAANYAYDQRFSVEGPSHHLWIHDGSGAVNGDECSVDVRTVNTIDVQSDAYADDWVVDLGSDWTGLDGTDALLKLPVSQYDTVKLDGTSAGSPVKVDFVGTGTPLQFTTDNDQTPDIQFDNQWGALRAVKGGSSTDTIDLSGLPFQTATISVLGNDGSDVITGSDGSDTISGGAGSDQLSGGPGSDTVDGNDGDDQLYGGGGWDVIHDGDGSDVLDGDWADGEDGYGDQIDAVWDFGYPDQIGDATASYDEVVFYTEGAPVTATLDGVQNDGAFGEDNLLGADSIQTFAGDDVIGGDDFHAIDTGAGNDTLTLGPAFHGMLDWQAGDGTDTLDASAFNGSLHGAFYPGGSMLMTEGAAPGNIDGGGWETVKGGLLGDDLTVGCACTMIPGQGNDTIRFSGSISGGTYVAGPAGDGADTVTVDDGISGVKADYSIRSAAVSLTIDGEANDGATGEGDDLDFGITALVGGTGNDTLAGSTSADTLDGFAGDDRLLGRGGNDRLIGDVGIDTLDGGSGNDVLLGQDGADKLYGRDGDDVLRGDDKYGTAGNDTLDGGAGDDDLFGYGGNDTFTEGAAANGSDLIAGGAGVDTASYAARTATVTLSLNGVYDDGAAGEGDRIGTDVENLTGGKGGDTLTGNDAVNTLTGGAGKDKLYGKGGNDTFQTVDSTADTLDGGTGTDRAHRDSIDTTTSVEQRF
ncbi:calcium-binding protein [Nocardioides jiangxiensis]|uniref:Calcium-binding protein n=1 Tax=Nocardioides jiangxiensis TaxID=3064524 RepID=A0ABT9AYU2_9ACTN|nr:calcium-binding protein [Nocardioides sp. WY-20]MDO7867756.1 calcium-binding protein [Nocardioides sp. WY-20]